MADRLKPEHKEIVDKIRILEKEIAPTKHNFKQYRNYFVPKQIVETSKTVLSFGVGGDVGFEKMMLCDNPSLRVELYDPTPWCQQNIFGIKRSSGRKELRDIQSELCERYKVATWKEWNKLIMRNLNFTPIGYSPTNGKRKFYFKQIYSKSSGKAFKPELHTKSFSAFDPTGTKNSVEVEFKNLETIMAEQKLSELEIVKTDIEGFCFEFAKELLEKQIKFKVWATEVELGLTASFEQNFEEVREMCANLGKDNYIFVNRRRLKPMLELIFVNKNES
tara:strand:+ start:298 stop:1128 length:831 start_codon:yes stop_codon:yes gene_type:complete